jgi:hypothetical protein
MGYTTRLDIFMNRGPRPSLRQRCRVLGLMFQRVASSFSFIIIFCMVDSVSG